MNKQKGFSTILGIIIGLLVIGGGFHLYTQRDVEIVDPANPPESFVDESINNNQSVKQVVDYNETTTKPIPADKVFQPAEQYGLTIKYPDDWSVREIVDKNSDYESKIIIVDNSGGKHSIEIFKESLNVSDFVNKFYGIPEYVSEIPLQNYISSNINLDGNNALRIDYETPSEGSFVTKSILIFVKHDDYIFRISSIQEKIDDLLSRITLK